MENSYDQEFLKQLKDNFLKYKEKYYKAKNINNYRTLFSLHLLLEFITNEEQIELPEYTYGQISFPNQETFKNVNEKDLEESCLPLKEYFDADYDYETELSSLTDQEIISLTNEFLKYSQVDDPNILNNFIKEKRITKIKSQNDEIENYNGIYIYNNFEPDKSYIYIDSPTNTYEDVSTLAHELGHDMQCKKPREIASDFNLKTLYDEVISQYYELKFYNFLIDENIAKKEGKSLKSCFLDSTYEFLEDIKETQDVESMRYGYGALIAVSINDLSKEEFKSFNQNLIYNQDVKLLNKVISNKKNLQKCLTKEINKLMK